MNLITRGFHGRRGNDPTRIPPGQYETHDFPVLTAGPTPRVDTDTWTLTITTETGTRHTWTWRELLALPQQTPHVDIHCVTRWSKLDTDWTGVSLDTLLEDVETTAEHALAHSHGGYTTGLPLQDLTDGQAWIAHTLDGEPLTPEHGGPARLLVPHLYFWKSAKWISGLTLLHDDEPGFWEQAGYHPYGDPWREQRYQGD
ncbi:Protein-methionine-sulfoxide reductase catalytic subunit MsrP [Nocardiopsis dassonvillei]|uniref:molybdopterin-dependent oxidoreductase n=1 Tax=Nocardiopsis dassonvillei TaxID=2014 RepID=UPI003F57EA8F